MMEGEALVTSVSVSVHFIFNFWINDKFLWNFVWMLCHWKPFQCHTSKLLSWEWHWCHLC